MWIGIGRSDANEHVSTLWNIDNIDLSPIYKRDRGKQWKDSILPRTRKVLALNKVNGGHADMRPMKGIGGYLLQDHEHAEVLVTRVLTASGFHGRLHRDMEGRSSRRVLYHHHLRNQVFPGGVFPVSLDGWKGDA